MSMVSEFKEFALKGNVMDLAVGVIIGGAFGKIISSLVDDVMTSGATLAAAAEVCVAGGAKAISVVTLARVAKDA